MYRSTQLLLAAILTLVPVVAFAQTTQTAPFGLSGLRIAFLSPQRAFSESEEGKLGTARLKALQDKGALEIEARTKALRTREQALQQSLGVLNEETRTQRARELEKFRLDVEARILSDRAIPVAATC